MIDYVALANLLGGYRFYFNDERTLQDDIERVLIDNNVEFEREPTGIQGSRPDFVVAGGIAVEVKIKRSLSDLLRQLHRYATLTEVTSIVVVTSRMHLSNIPDTLMGKPVEVVTLVGAFK